MALGHSAADVCAHAQRRDHAAPEAHGLNARDFANDRHATSFSSAATLVRAAVQNMPRG
jgi:hypothetical protein